MQNKFLYQILCVSLIALTITPAFAQEADDFLVPTEESANKVEATVPSTEQDEVTPDLAGKKAVDFPSRTSLDSLELAPLPGIYETNITGPVPLAPSVSAKDMPSERLLGRLTPEVFQEMAELERDNTFLKLQIQKETMKNDLEKLRANYRQARLDEIAKREDVVRTRIQWWQEQEKVRQDMEAQRAAVEGIKVDGKAAPEKEAFEDDIPEEIEQELLPAPQEEDKVAPINYTLLGIIGTQNALTAKIRDVDSQRLFIVQVGDQLPNDVEVASISPTELVLKSKKEQKTLTFEDK